MSYRIIGIIGLCITISFVIGFTSLFIYNPKTFEEVNYVPSMASFNIKGMDGRWLAAYFIYLVIGILHLVFAVGLLKLSPNDLPVVIGKVFILISGLIWTSFGIISWDLNLDLSIHTLIGRVVSLLIIAPLGLMLVGDEFERIIKDRFIKYYTLATGLIILLIGVLSVTVFNDQTWVRTNISISIYFLWFGIVGLRFVQGLNNTIN